MAGAALGESAVHDEREEADEEAHRLGTDEGLRVDDRCDRRADDAAEDLPNEDRAREEGEQTTRLFGVVEVAGVDPEEDVDRLLDPVREHIRDRLDDVPDRIEGDRVLDPDRRQGDGRDVEEEHRAATHAIDEEEDERGDRKHRDRRDDVHPRNVLDAVALYEERVGAQLSDPVGADHDGEQEVQEEGESPFAAPQGHRVPQ